MEIQKTLNSQSNLEKVKHFKHLIIFVRIRLVKKVIQIFFYKVSCMDFLANLTYIQESFPILILALEIHKVEEKKGDL